MQLQQHLNAAVSDAQHWAYIAHMAETTNAAETAKATAGTGPSRRTNGTNTGRSSPDNAAAAALRAAADAAGRRQLRRP